MALPKRLYYASPSPVTRLTKDWRTEAAEDGTIILSRTAAIASDWVEEAWSESDDGSDLYISMYEIEAQNLNGRLKPMSGSRVDFAYKPKKGEAVPMVEIPWARLADDERD